MHSLVVVGQAVQTHTVKAFPKSPARSLGDDGIQSVNDLFVSFQPIHLGPVQHRTRQAYDSAGPGL